MSVRGGAFAGGGQAIKFILQLTFNIILFRLLTPVEFGLIAMVTSIMSIVRVLKDLGLTTAIVQKKQISHAQASNLFWINSAFSLLVVFALIASSSALATWFNRVEVQTITYWIALSFLPIGISGEHRAILVRQMHFGRIALVEIISITIAVTTAIVAAFLGAGYWALVIYHIVQNTGIGIGLWVACGWIPGLPRRDVSVRSLLKFGGNMLAFNLVNVLSKNFDQILIGKYLGPVSLGFYERAYRIVVQPVGQVQYPLSNVAIPGLSRLQDEPKRYKKYHSRVIGMIGLVISPVMTLAVIMAPELIPVVCGSGWDESVPLFAILGISAIFTPYSFTAGWLMASQGRVSEMLRMGIINSILSILAIIVGLQWGAIGVAWGVCLNLIFLKIPFVFWMAGKRGPVSIMEIANQLPFPLFISAVVGVTAFGYRSWFNAGSDIVNLIAATGLSVIAASIVIVITPRGRRSLKEMREMIVLFRSK